MCDGGFQEAGTPDCWLADAAVDSSDDDEDDDDDNDGHSSMLSNASLRRKVPLGGGRSTAGSTTKFGSDDSQSHAGKRQQQQSSSQQSSSSSSSTNAAKKKTSLLFGAKSRPAMATTRTGRSAALTLRGGAAAEMGAEFAQKLLVTALITLVYEGLIGHVLEFTKIVMQTSPDGTTYAQVLKKITSQKGIGGLWDGFVPWGVVQSIFKGSVFGLAHAIASGALIPLAEKGTIPMQLAQTVAGGVGGGFQGFVLSPTLLLKTRVMTNEVFREKMSVIKTTRLSLSIG
jgi:hypothetical protein